MPSQHHRFRAALTVVMSSSVLARSAKTSCRDEVSDTVVSFVDSCLDWQRQVTADQEKLPWEATWVDNRTAAKSCALLDLSGGGWRLPTRTELATIALHDNSYPSIDIEKFAGTPPMLFWTSEPSGPPSRPEPYTLDFSNNGKVMLVGPDGAQHFRCVRISGPTPPSPPPVPSPMPVPTPAPTPGPMPSPTPAGSCHAISPVVSDDWCTSNCHASPPNCPEGFCSCDPAPNRQNVVV